MLFTVEQAHPGPGTSGAGALQTLSLPRSAFGLRLVWFNKAVVGTWKFLSWDVARAQDRQVPKIAAARSLLAAPRAEDRPRGLRPSGTEPFSRLGGAKVLLTPPTHQVSACTLLQQKELHCPGSSVVPSPAKSSSRIPSYKAASPMPARGISSLFWGQEDDREKG